jgi:hypothetical protein
VGEKKDGSIGCRPDGEKAEEQLLSITRAESRLVSDDQHRNHRIVGT